MSVGSGVSRRIRRPKTTAVYDTYWRFAMKRQEIFHRRVRGEPGPWTEDIVLKNHRFTNPYRAADRVSQYMIRKVVYEGDRAPEEVVFRTLLFKLFNRVSTWELLSNSFPSLSARDFNVDQYDDVLSKAFDRGERIYSGAYIMPAASRGAFRKHRTHLELLEFMLNQNLARTLVDAGSMRDAFSHVLTFSGIGEFLAYQFVTDLNYSEILNYSEMEFVMAGPGARSGIRKCFEDTAGLSDEDIIRYVTDRQADEFSQRDLEFDDLWGRPLQLIDCQNLFCEVDKYARIVHPDAKGIGERTRIKQRFLPVVDPIEVWFPPKWGINSRLPANTPLADKLDPSRVEIHFDSTSSVLVDKPPDLVASEDCLLPLVCGSFTDFESVS